MPSDYFLNNRWPSSNLAVYVVDAKLSSVIETWDRYFVALGHGSARICQTHTWHDFEPTMRSNVREQKLFAFENQSGQTIYLNEARNEPASITRLCWQLRASGRAFSFDSGSKTSDGNYLCAYEDFVAGKATRYVRTMMEDPASGIKPVWSFFEKGIPLSQEQVDIYKNRLTKKRMNNQVLLELAQRLGYEFGSTEFWLSSKLVAYRVIDPWGK